MDTSRLTIVPFEDVTLNQASYNSQAHTPAEIAAALSKTTLKYSLDIEHAWPPPSSYAYGHYAALVAESQHIPSSKRLSLAMPRVIARDLLTLQASYLATNHSSESRVAELAEDWADCKGCRSILDAAFADGAKWFVRLDDASPKDSPTRLPVNTAKQLVRVLATSMRARAEVERKLEQVEEITVFLRPWDEDMNTGLEFRCFIPPIAIHSARTGGERASMTEEGWKISAMSQYTWHRPFPSANLMGLSLQETTTFALTGAKKNMAAVISTARKAGTLRDLQRYGFVMDVVIKLSENEGEREVQLVEINPFGAVSGCGSCLFHWLKDAEQLYGLSDDVKIRVAAETSDAVVATGD